MYSNHQNKAASSVEVPSLAQLLADNKWIQLVEIAIVFSPVLVAILAFRLMSWSNPMLLIGAVWVANVVMLGLAALGIKLRGESLDSIGLTFERPSISVFCWALLKSILFLVFAASAFIFGTIVMANVVGIPEGADMTKYNYLQGNLPMLLLSLAGVYVVSSFGEEVVYRGFLITRLQSLFGGKSRIAVISALVTSSLIFGFAHFEWGPTGIVQTTFMGAALGACFLWDNRNLWPLILAHGLMDTLLLVPLYLMPESAA